MAARAELMSSIQQREKCSHITHWQMPQTSTLPWTPQDASTFPVP